MTQQPSPWKRFSRFMTKPRGDRRWDLLVRATGLVALLGIPVVVFFPQATPLVWFAVAAIPANSPLSPITPVAFEPLIMEAAKHSAAIEVTLVGLGAYMYMEYLNFHLYKWVLERRRLQRFKEHKWVKRALRGFSRAPAVVILVFAFTPLPFWTVRILAIYRKYSVARFMAATAVGRLPRIFIYAWLGERLMVPSVLLVAAAVGATAVVVAIKLAKRQALIHDEVLDDQGSPASESSAAETALPDPSDPEPVPSDLVTAKSSP